MQVKQAYEWETRTRLLARAQRIQDAGHYSEGDIHLLNWFLVGNCKIFKRSEDGDGASDVSSSVG